MKLNGKWQAASLPEGKVAARRAEFDFICFPQFGRRRSMLKAALLSLVVWIVGLPSVAVAQEAMEWHLTITDAKLQLEDGKTGTVPKGEVVYQFGRPKNGRLDVMHFDMHRTLVGSIEGADVIPSSEAFDFLNEEVQRHPSALAYIRRSAAWMCNKKFDKALADCNQAIRLDPKNADAYCHRGIAWDGENEGKKALADYNEALRLDPKNVTAYCCRAATYRAKSRIDQALADYDAALRLDPANLVASQNRASLFEMKAKSDKALAECDRALRLDPRDARNYDRRGSAWMALGLSEKAIADWTEAIRLDPEDIGAYKTRGSAWMSDGQYDKAIADWSAVIRLNPNLTLAYNNRAYAWMKQAQLDKAIADWTEALRLDPKDVSALNNRGSAWSAKGEYDKAITDYKAAIRVDSRCGEAYWGLASVLATCPDAKYRDGKTALENAERASRLIGLKDSEFVSVLAAACAAAGDFELAVKWQETAIDLAPKQSKAQLHTRLELYKARKPYQARPEK
jgi:tetratricopeptide (TPR) repeat protein